MRVLSARAISVSYGARQVLHSIDFELAAGEVVAIVGPNGAGKTTLLRALSGTIPEASGEITLDGRPLTELSRREVAQHIAVVPQDVPSAPGFTVREVIAMGRAPHQSAWLRERTEDSAAVRDAMERCALTAFGARPFDALSGGERKRVLIAQALAQCAKVLLLDEPSAFLDLGHAVATFELARKEAERGVAVAAIVHDFGLAARYADRVLLLAEGRVVASGSPAVILDEANLSAAFAVPIRRLEEGTTLAFAPAPGRR